MTLSSLNGPRASCSCVLMTRSGLCPWRAGSFVTFTSLASSRLCAGTTSLLTGPAPCVWVLVPRCSCGHVSCRLLTEDPGPGGLAVTRLLSSLLVHCFVFGFVLWFDLFVFLAPLGLSCRSGCPLVAGSAAWWMLQLRGAGFWLLSCPLL